MTERELFLARDAARAARRPGGAPVRARRRPPGRALSARVHEPRTPRRGRRAEALLATVAAARPAPPRARLRGDRSRRADGEADGGSARGNGRLPRRRLGL